MKEKAEKTYQFATSAKGEAKLLVAETRGFLRFPKRYLNEIGQLLEGAPYCERHIRQPIDLQTHDEAGDFDVIVKQRGTLTRMVLDHHPFDAEIDHLVDCIREDRESHCNIADAYRTHELCMAIDRSVEEGGTTVKLPLE